MTKTALMLDKLTPSAKIVDGILILTLPDAIRPVVWQMELGQAKTSAMEVRDNPDGTFVLMLKTGRQDVQEVATYATQDQAVRALIAVSKTLHTAQGLLRPANANLNPHHLPAIIPDSEAGRTKLARVGLAVILIAALVFAVSRMGPSNGPTNISPAAGPSASGATGEGVDADDFLSE